MKNYHLLFMLFLIPGWLPGMIPSQTGKSFDSTKVITGKESDHDEIKTLAGNQSHSGGYGAVFFKGTDFKDRNLLIAGIRGAWVVNRSFGIGIDLNGIIPTAKYSGIDPAGIREAVLTGGYGGMLLEPILWSNKMIHLTFPISFGAGWLGYLEDWENRYDYYEGKLYDEDVFWYFEPGFMVEVNVGRFFRAGFSLSRRFTQDLRLINTSSRAFDELNYGVVLKFGGF
jgi:hypothetical protein